MYLYINGLDKYHEYNIKCDLKQLRVTIIITLAPLGLLILDLNYANSFVKIHDKMPLLEKYVLKHS